MDSYDSGENLRHATDGGVVFSSTKCPAPSTDPTITGRLEQTCELPFGFLYTPMTNIPPQLSASIPSSPNLPSGVICKVCMSYLNLYCETSETYPDTDATNGNRLQMRWTCALCKSENIIAVECPNDDTCLEEQRSTELLLNTLTTQRVLEFHQPLMPPSSTTATERDSSMMPTKTIILVVDTNLPSSDAIAIGNVLRSIVDQCTTSEQRFSWQLGLIVFGESVSIFRLGVAYSGIAVADVVRSYEGFEVLTDADSGSDINSRSYLGISIDELVACLSTQFSTAESNVSENAFDANDDVRGSTDNISKKTRLQILKERKDLRLNRQEIQASRNDNDRKDLLLRSPWAIARERVNQSKPPYRCTGDALLCAIDLASLDSNSFRSAETTNGTASAVHDCRVLLFTNGCPNLGDGSVVDTNNDSTGGLSAYSTVDSAQMARACGFFDAIGKSALDIGVGIDVLCTGSSELCFPAYISLVEASSGYVISHDSFTSSRFQSNMGYIVQHTHTSRSYFHVQNVDESGAVELPESSKVLPHSMINGCTVDIKMSSFLTSTHLIGPGDMVESPSEPLLNEQMSFLSGKLVAGNDQLTIDELPSIDVLQATLTRIRIGRYDPLSTFSVMLRVNDSYHGNEHAFFQFIVRFVDICQQVLVTRITSHRLSVANDIGEFLEAVDEEVVPVLLAKEAVYRSMFGRDAEIDHPFHSAAYLDELDRFAYDAQQDLDNTVFRISGAYRLLSLVQGTKSVDLTEEGGIKARGSSMDFAFPPELSDALRRLYHLRRGPLLSPGPVQSADDRVEVRTLFVRFPLSDCLSMMAPSLWSSGPLAEAMARNAPSLQNVPPETLALWENRIIAADHWNNIFIWSGKETLHLKYNIIKEQLQHFLETRSRRRFPQPNLYILNETDSMSRRFTSLLAPSHGDLIEHQVEHYHELANLSKEELTKLNFRFRFYDPEEDPSFRKWFWEVASAASTLGTDGVSLCD